MALSPDGELLASASNDKVGLLDGGCFFCFLSFSPRLTVGPKPTYLPTYHSSLLQTVRIWQVANGACKHVLTDHDHVVEAVAFAPATTAKYANVAIFGSVRRLA